MAAVSCRESDEKNDTDVFKSQSRSCFTVGPQDPSVQLLMTSYFSVRYEAVWVLFWQKLLSEIFCRASEFILCVTDLVFFPFR